MEAFFAQIIARSRSLDWGKSKLRIIAVNPHYLIIRHPHAFRVAIFAEIESRLTALAKLSAEGAPDLEDTCILLSQLQGQLDAAVDEEHR